MLEIKELYAGYGPIEVLHGISIEAKPSEVVSIIGSNGAGKSTLLKTISGLLQPSKGVISIDGVIINGWDPSKIVKSGIVHVPEGRHIFPNLTVYENLLLGGFFESSKENKDNLDFVFKTFPILKKRINLRAGMLSGGEQQMLAISRGLMGKPKFLLLDEPSLGLAPNTAQEVFKIILKLSKEENIGVILVEQNAKKALEISDMGYVFVIGRVGLSGSADDLKNNSEVQKLYLGGKNA